MKKVIVDTILILLVATSINAVTITTETGSGADTYCYEQNPNGNYGTETSVRVKETGTTTGRKSWLKFDISSLGGLAVTSARLDLVLTYKATSRADTTSVYGVKNDVDLDGWNETTITWWNAPANDTGGNGFTTNAVLLGYIIGIGSSSVGSVITFSNQALTDFLNTDTDGLVTIAMNLDSEASANQQYLFASKENTTYAPPTLEIITTNTPSVIEWQLDKNNPLSPLDLHIGNLTLEVLNMAGPVFDYGGGTLEPSDYDVELLDYEFTNNYHIYNCRATNGTFSSDYTLKFKLLDNNSIEMLVSGTNNVSYLKIGNISSEAAPYKQFYTGERNVENFYYSDNYTAVTYIPHSNLYIYGTWDKDYSNAAYPDNRSKPKSHFILNNPAVTIDAYYGTMTDGKRQNLKERFVLRFSTNLWEVYGPVLNQPSPYGTELTKMVYFDSWVGKFCYNIKAFEFLNKAVPDKIKFYTTIQHWAAWYGWDTTNPDAYRIPDHTTPWPAYGTAEQLELGLSMAKQRGYAGFRYNYLHVGPKSWSFQEGIVKKALKSSGETNWFTDIVSTKLLAERQEGEVKRRFDTTASFHDQWGSVGFGSSAINYDANLDGAAKLSTVRKEIRKICLLSKATNQGPIFTESMFSEYLIGEYVDSGDFAIFGGDLRYDFFPEYKLRRLHELTTFYSMGLGYRYFYMSDKPLGEAKYFGSDVELDSYRTCEVLYGNGAYLYAKAAMRKVHMLTECLTVGLAQRYYAMQSVDYVKYSNGGPFTEFQNILPAVNSLTELRGWFKQFHIRYTNGCHVWINRDDSLMDIATPANGTISLTQNCWLVYMENSNFIAYTAVCTNAAGVNARADFCEDKNLKIKYANPRTLDSFMGVSKPTVWTNGAISFILEDPETTIGQMSYENGTNIVTTATGIGADAYVYQSNPAGNYGTDSTFVLKDYAFYPCRKSYLKFDLCLIPNYLITNSTLSFVVTGNSYSSSDTIGVYGINDAAELDGWSENSINWFNAPANVQDGNGFDSNAIHLGDVSIPAVGGIVKFSSSALTDFVDADTDNQVTIALNINMAANGGGSFATKENTTYAPPTLEVLQSIPEPGLFIIYQLLFIIYYWRKFKY